MKTEAVGMYMSKSDLSPSDAAWAVLKQTNDPDKVEKLLPLIPLAVGGLMGAHGAYTGAGGKIYDTETGEWFVNPWDKDAGNAKVVDPITGGYLYENELGTSASDRALGAGVGALQAINPFSYVRGAGAAARGAGAALASKPLARTAGSRLAARGGRADATRRTAARAEAAGDVGPVSQFSGAPAQYGIGSGGGMRMTKPAVTPAMQRQAKVQAVSDKAARLTGPGKQTQMANRLTGYGNSPTSFRPTQPMGRGMALAGRATQLAGPVAGLAGTILAQNTADDYSVDPNTSGFGAYGGTGSGGFGQSNTGGAASGFGEGTDIGDLSNQSSKRTGLQDIWTGKENTMQFGGGFGMGEKATKGENMKIGERMLKQAEDIMYKAVCPACGKKDCIGKAHCGTLKADDKKKPAHGMVIVIGTKAGPGPYKNGKREKLDSEKDEKEE